MVNSLYINSAAALIIIVIISTFVISYSNGELGCDIGTRGINGAKYAKHNGRVISVPSHILNSLIIKCKSKLIDYAQIRNVNMSPELKYKFNNVEHILSKYIYIKYKIKISPQPHEVEKYILDHGINSKIYSEKSITYIRTSTFDEESIEDTGISERIYCIGKIMWYLEKILILGNKSDANDLVEIPLQLDSIKEILEIDIEVPHIAEEIMVQNIAADNLRDIGNVDIGGTINHSDQFDLMRNSLKAAPKKCSKMLRTNLYDFISDSAAANPVDPFGVGDDGNQKAKNSREAMSSWRSGSLHRSADISHSRDSNFADSFNRDVMKVQHGNKHLAYNIAASTRENMKPINQKQSLTDDWDYLEADWLSQ